MKIFLFSFILVQQSFLFSSEISFSPIFKYYSEFMGVLSPLILKKQIESRYNPKAYSTGLGISLPVRRPKIVKNKG